MRIRLLTVTGALALSASSVLSACSSSGSPRAASTTTRATGVPVLRDLTRSTAPKPAVTTTTAAPVTTTAPPAPTTTVAPVVLEKPTIGIDGCELYSMPPDATVTATKVADVNGDGHADTVQSYYVGSDAALRVMFGGGGGFTTAITSPNAGGGATRIVGTTPLSGLGSGDGSEQVFATVERGSGSQTVEIFSYTKCGLSPVLFPNGQPARFVVGGSAMHSDGARCDGAGGGVVFAVLSANSADGTQFTTAVQGYRYSHGSFQSYGPAITGHLALPADEGELAGYATVDCAGITI